MALTPPFGLRNSWRLRIGFILAGLIVAGAIAEIIARNIRGVVSPLNPPPQFCNHCPNTHFTWTGYTGEFAIHGRWNSIGMNDVEHSIKKPPNVKRIVIVGDSFVEALQVPLGQSFFRILQSRLGDGYEVITLGQSGAGPRHYLWLLRKFGLLYDPDLVIFVLFAFNDLRNDSPVLNRMHDSNEFGGALEFYKLFKRATRKYHYVPLDLGIYSAHYTEEWVDAWAMVEHTLLMAKLKAHNQFFLTSVGATATVQAQQKWFELYPAMSRRKWSFNHPEQVLSGIARKRTIAYRSLDPILNESGASIYFEKDGHWNARGHNLVAGWFEDVVLKLL